MGHESTAVGFVVPETCDGSDALGICLRYVQTRVYNHGINRPENRPHRSRSWTVPITDWCPIVVTRVIHAYVTG